MTGYKSVVAIHQPNHLPWLGYFRKIARADIFVFLDDAQFSKGSYINRVQVLAAGAPRWLTLPVSASLGKPINKTPVATDGWHRAQLDKIEAYYRSAPFFAEVFPVIADLLTSAEGPSIGHINAAVIMALAQRLGLVTPFSRSSRLSLPPASGDARLVAIVRALGGQVYLSGGGGAKYQDATAFERAEICLRYNDTDLPSYDQGGIPFVPGLSVIDALFWTGFAATARLIRGK